MVAVFVLIYSVPCTNQTVPSTRQALIEGGFARVRELVDAGVLPAVMVGLVGGGLAASLSTPQGDGQTF